MKNGSTTAKLLAACSLALSALVAHASPSAAEANDDKPVTTSPYNISDPVPDGFRSWEEVNALQERLSTAADQIMNVVDAGDGEGYGSMSVSLQGRRLNLYWKGGRPSARVQTVLNQLTEQGTPIQVAASRYSAAELESAAEALMNSAVAARKTPDPSFSAGARVTSVAPRPDSSGLDVGISGSLERASGLPELRDVQVPISLTQRPETVRTAFSRWNDSAPFYAGGHFSEEMACSTSFATGQSTTAGQGLFMLTAAHCVSDNHPVYTSYGTKMGTVIARMASRDIASIQIPQHSAGYVYNGAPISDLGPLTASRVYGSRRSLPGELVCTSGSYSGTRCSIYVAFVNVTAFDDNGNLVTKLVEGYHMGYDFQPDHLQIARHGDSGGPVEQWAPDHRGVYAKGIISGGVDSGYTVVCSGVGSGECYDTIRWADIKTAEILWGNVTTVPAQ